MLHSNHKGRRAKSANSNRPKEIDMYTNRFFSIVLILTLVAVVAFTVREAMATDLLSQEAQRIQRSRNAETARWVATGQYYQQLEEVHRQRSRAADAARWAALGEYYENLEVVESLQRGRDADAARWTAMAEYYTQVISPTR
jgi:ABC-type multidrug transport system fused ATPase/permease subunit